MAEIKNRRVILEAMEIMDTLSDVQNFDGKEKIVEILDSIGGDEGRLARDLGVVFHEKGYDPQRFEAFIVLLKEAFTNADRIGEEGGGGADNEDDIFFNPAEPKNTIKSQLGSRTLSQTRQRDEEGDRAPQGPGQGRRIKYEEL